MSPRLRRARRRGAPPSLPTGWLGPTSMAGWTAVGALDATAEACVDRRGLVTPRAGGWSLDWWIGAEDRWHVPARETGGVRQALVSATPVVETRMRIPSGDAVQRVYAARAADGAEVVVLEVENASPIPVALALAVRPYDHSGPSAVERIELDGTIVRVDGDVGFVLPKRPSRVAGSTGAGGDVVAVVTDGRADVELGGAITCPDGLAHAAFVFPLAHTAVLRVVLPQHRAEAHVVSPVPAAAQVVSGWLAHDTSGMRAELPEQRLQEAFDAARRSLLARPLPPDPADRAEVLVARTRTGFGAIATPALAALPPEPTSEASAALLRAVSEHWSLVRDRELIDQLVPAIAVLVERTARGLAAGEVSPGRARTALVGAGRALRAVGEARAADDVERLVDNMPAPEIGREARLVERLGTLLASASPTWTWSQGSDGHHAATTAAFVSLVRSLLVRDPEDGAVEIAPVVPPAWFGHAWEVHDAPTSAGRLGYAVRWHGERPALLWELEPHPQAVVRLRAPGLDRAWATSEPCGEALLAPVRSEPAATIDRPGART